MALVDSRAADISLYVEASRSGVLLEADCLVFLVGGFTFDSSPAANEQALILGQFYRDWGISAVPVVVRWGMELEAVDGARGQAGPNATLYVMPSGEGNGPDVGRVPFVAPSKGIAIHLAGPHLFTSMSADRASIVLDLLLDMVADRDPTYAAALYGTCLETPLHGLSEYWKGILGSACYLSRCGGEGLEIPDGATGISSYGDLRLLPATALADMGLRTGGEPAVCSRWGLSIDDMRHIVRIHQLMAEAAAKAQLSQIRDTFHDTLSQLSELTGRYRELEEALTASKQRAAEFRVRERKSVLKRAKASLRKRLAAWRVPPRQAEGVLSVRQGMDPAEWVRGEQVRRP